MIKEHVETKISGIEYDAYVKTILELKSKNKIQNESNLPYDKESFYYRKIFENFFRKKVIMQFLIIGDTHFVPTLIHLRVCLNFTRSSSSA